LAFDEADTVDVRVNWKGSWRSKVELSGSWNTDAEYRLMNLFGRLEGEALVGKRHPFVFGIRDDELLVDS